ncbi:ANTAR domain-containing protein [Streptomyces melanogenes]|uniref:ANTAR domain-containing protein n=1 Tax=Streptomyces melanogenes TaxID=67326 RepID=A0ABZ1XD08_9ACTN|nr:ANTAR domain-containing protein [Streptomyces melanogenes]
MAQPSHSAESDETGSVASVCPVAPDGGPSADPVVELGQLRRAMESRATIDLARGVLMAAFAISPEAAWSALVMTSQNTNTKLHRVAQQVVDSAGGAKLAEPVQKQLSAAIAKLATAAVDGAGGGQP